MAYHQCVSPALPSSGLRLKVKVCLPWLPPHWMQRLALPSDKNGGLILPSSARVSLLTYQTVLGVRYPELVKATADGWKYGRYVSTEATLQGGFLPVFWGVPKSNIHAVSDLGALVEWLQANIAFGHDSANNLPIRIAWWMTLG